MRSDIMSMRNIKRPVDRDAKTGISVMTHEIPEIIENYYEYVVFYLRYKKFGSPYPGGWLDYPFWILEILEELKAADYRLAENGA